MIELRHLQKKYENTEPLKDVSAVIHDGDVISVIGPSGAGKSTLLRCINLLERPTGGQIFVDGEEISSLRYDASRVRRKIGMVFQSFNLFGHLTVIENIMMAQVDLLGKSRQEAYDTGMELLRRVGLADRALDYPDQLSGGQKQRVAIARTLAMDPDVILLDEPTSALDPTMVGEVQAVIRDLARSGKTMMIVTHEMNFARAICSRVFYMDQGGIYEDGTPDQLFDHPEKELTRRFIRRLKILELEIRGREYDFPAAGTQIDGYCMKNTIPARTRYRIRLAFEELIQQILFPRLEDPHIHVTVEYSEKLESVSMTVLYKGEPFDPAETENALSYSVIKGIASRTEHSLLSGEEWTNEFRIGFR